MRELFIRSISHSLVTCMFKILLNCSELVSDCYYYIGSITKSLRYSHKIVGPTLRSNLCFLIYNTIRSSMNPAIILFKNSTLQTHIDARRANGRRNFYGDPFANCWITMILIPVYRLPAIINNGKLPLKLHT